MGPLASFYTFHNFLKYPEAKIVLSGKMVYLGINQSSHWLFLMV